VHDKRISEGNLRTIQLKGGEQMKQNQQDGEAPRKYKQKETISSPKTTAVALEGCLTLTNTAWQGRIWEVNI
jgi:hypothetical protein